MTETIGFVGIGVMGKSMAGHLLKAGHEVHIFSRTKEKAKELIEAGAIWELSTKELAPKCRFIFTMVGYPRDVEEVYLGPAGLIANAKRGSYLIDTTTSKPDLARVLYDEAKTKGLFALDAPVSGGDVGARNATLTIMTGGDKAAFDAVLPLLSILGKTVILQGPAGAGQHTKMANQIAIAGSLVGTVESLIYSRKAGLNPRTVLESISNGSAGSWQLLNLAPKMLDGNFAPGFYAKHFLKDLRIALDAAKEMKAELPMLDMVEGFFAKLSTMGLGDEGTQALYKLYETMRS